LFELARSKLMETGFSTTRSLSKSPALAFSLHGKAEEPEDSLLKKLIQSNTHLIVGAGKKTKLYSFSEVLRREGVKLEDGIDHLKKSSPETSLVFEEGEKVLDANRFLPLVAEYGQRALASYYGHIYLIDFQRPVRPEKVKKHDDLLLETEAFNDALMKLIKGGGQKTLIVVIGGRGGDVPLVKGSTPEKGQVDYSWHTRSEELLSYVPVFAYGPGSERIRGIISPTDLYGILSEFIRGRK
jgi:hypothetical protein